MANATRRPAAGARAQQMSAMGRTKRELLTALLIFGLTLFIFLHSPLHWVSDSQFSMLLSQSLLRHRSFTLDHYAMPRQVEDALAAGNLYQLEAAGEHLYYHLPPGTSVLSAPFVAVLNLFGVSAETPEGVYDPRGEETIQSILAAVLMAALAVLFFYTALLLLPASWSAVVALGGALGTQVWSTASRAMWSHTWEILLLGLVILLLVGHETGRRKLRPVWLGTLLSWTYFVRPTSSVVIVAVCVYLLLYHRRAFVPVALTGAAWLAGFLAYSWYHFGKALPTYFRPGRLDYSQFWTALAGNLVSPARGLLVYVPVLLFVAYALARYRKELAFPRLAALALAVVAGHLLVLAGFSPWHGGHCYGPRFTTDLVPWLVLLGALALQAMRRWREARGARAGAGAWRATLACGAALLLASVFVNGWGATSFAAAHWNVWPVDMSAAPERVWDWSYPQFLAGLVAAPTPPPAPPRPPDAPDWQTQLTYDPLHLLDHLDLSQFMYRIHKAAFGRMPRYEEFLADVRRVGKGVRQGDEGRDALAERNLRAHAEELVRRAAFRQLYGGASHERYVEQLFANAGVTPGEAERAALVKGLEDGAETRATVLLKVAGGREYAAREQYPSLVLFHFFAYLRRDPGAPPDKNMDGYLHWLGHVQFHGPGPELTEAFANSIERKELLGLSP